MKSYVDGQTEIPVSGATIAQILADVVTRYPSLRFHVFDSSGKIRRHINLFINEDNIKNLDDLETPVGAGDKVILLPSISGG
jgi:molybdopterin converting factor small subunit